MLANGVQDGERVAFYPLGDQGLTRDEQTLAGSGRVAVSRDTTEKNDVTPPGGLPLTPPRGTGIDLHESESMGVACQQGKAPSCHQLLGCLCFRPDLTTLLVEDTPAGVVNLHRLKRLYRDPVTGHRAHGAARALAGQLDQLAERGWKLVWTVHNLLPIDGDTLGLVDHQVVEDVLRRVTVVITHTQADAAALRRRTTAPVLAAGWAGLPACLGPPEPIVARLTGQMRRSASVLCLGNITDYKNLPDLARRWHEHTIPARLFLIGPARDRRLLAEILRWASDRILVHPHRVAPDQVGHLYAAAVAAVCPYRVDGPYRFFAEVLHPSSVGTARGFGVPIVAPELPAIIEMTNGHPRLLYPSQDGPGPVLDELDKRIRGSWSQHNSALRHSGADQRWPRIVGTYRQLARHLNGGLSHGC